MTIVYFYQYFGTPAGGWSTRVYEMTRRWVAEGHKVIVVTTPYDKSDIRASGFIDHQHIDGIDVLIINVTQSNKHSFIRRAWGAMVFSLLSIYYALTLKYDMAVASSGPITIGLPALIANWLRGKPYAFEVRDLWPRGAEELGVIKSKTILSWAYRFEKKLYTNANIIIACSEGMKTDIVARFPGLWVIVVPNSCDISLFRDNLLEIKYPSFVQDKKVVLYAGSLGLMDHCIQIVRAAEVLQQRGISDIVFVVIGEGAERMQLMEMATQLGLKNIFFLGLIPKKQVASWMSIAKVSLVVFKNVPMLNTSSPNKFFDSISAGVPVIQTTQGWIKEVLATHGGGITVSTDNASEMANAIHTVCYDQALRNKLALEARTMAETLYDRDNLSHYMLSQLIEAREK